MDDAETTAELLLEAGGSLGEGDLIAAIERRKGAVRKRREQRLQEIEAECVDALGRLDAAIAALGGGRKAAVAAKKGPSADELRKRPSRRKRTPASTTPAAAKARREAVLRYLSEAGKGVAPREIQRDLNLTPSCVQSALARLSEEGKAVRSGWGLGTRYVAKARAETAEGAAAPYRRHQGTPAGRTLQILEERTYATEGELIQSVGLSPEEAEKVFGALLAEEEVKMERREGRPVLVRCRTS